MKIPNATQLQPPHVSPRVVATPTPHASANLGGPVGRFPVPTPPMSINRKEGTNASDTAKLAQRQDLATLETAQGAASFDIGKHTNLGAKAVQAYKANEL